MTLITNIPSQSLFSTLPTSIGDRKYTWIEFWSKLIEFTHCNVMKGKHYYRFRVYEDSFSGCNITDTVFFYLYTYKNTFITEVTREKATKLCQLMFNCKILSHVSGKSDKFEDSSGKIYKFNAQHEVFSALDNSNSNMIFENITHNLRRTSKDMRRCSLSNLPHASSLNKYENDMASDQYTFESDIYGELSEDKDILLTSPPEGGKTSWRRRSSLILDSIGNKYEKYWLHSTPMPKHKQLLTQKEHLLQFASDDENYEKQNTIKENALSELTKLLEIPLLDMILQYSIQNPDEYPKHISHNYLFFDEEIRNSSDTTWIKGMFCLKCFDDEIGVDAYKAILSSNSSLKTRKVNLYSHVYSVCTRSRSPLWPTLYNDVHIGLLRQLGKGPLSVTLHAFKLAFVLLDVTRAWQLVALLDFLKAVMKDVIMQLSTVESNRSVIIKKYSPVIVQSKLMSGLDARTFVAFLIDHAQHFFFPNGFQPISNAPSCVQVTKDKYESEKLMNTNYALVEMMQQILKENKISLKDKKLRLNDFQKYHRHLYNLYFKDIKL